MNSNRRKFLRAASGATLMLPWMESLSVGATSMPPKRLAFYYVPIGVVRRSFFPGEEDALLPAGNNFDPKKITGREKIGLGFHEFPKTATLDVLRDVADDVTLITSLDRTFQIGTDVHAQCASCFLSSAAPFSVESSAWPLDRSLDQIVADSIGGQTPFRSLELSCNSHKDNLESIHFDNISWYGTGHVAPSVRDPRKLYRRLFGTQEISSLRNITDLVLQDARDLERELGRQDRDKFSEFLESLRAIEVQMDKLEQMRGELTLVEFEEPSEAYLPRSQYIRLMGDLMVVAFQTGLTNVATMMIGPERWNTPFMYDGVFDKPMSHHQMSHNQRKFSDELIKVDRFNLEQFEYLVKKMKAITESDGTSLLDNTLFTYGSGLGDGSTHQYSDLPIIVAGKGGGKFRSGGHLNCNEGTPLANLWLTQANIMGAEIQRFADSTGFVDQLLV